MQIQMYMHMYAYSCTCTHKDKHTQKYIWTTVIHRDIEPLDNTHHPYLYCISLWITMQYLIHCILTPKKAIILNVTPTWNDLINVHNKVRIPSPLLRSFTNLITRNRRKNVMEILALSSLFYRVLYRNQIM